MRDVAIVGGGLFGQIIAKQCRSLGMSVTVIDNREPQAGSAPAACLMKPSWFSSLGSDVYEPSLALLDKLYGVRDITFRVGPLTTQVHWCNPKVILSEPVVVDHVNSVAPGLLSLRDHGVIEARVVVVAAGIWSSSLVDVPNLTGRAGAAFLWPNHEIEQPFISPWAPYRQLVAFNRGDGLWVGDGTAIKPDNFHADRVVTSLNRCQDAVGLYIGNGADGPETLIGTRPYVPKAKPCHLVMDKRLIVATGGAKNGTLAAGWCAHRIGEFLS